MCSFVYVYVCMQYMHLSCSLLFEQACHPISIFECVFVVYKYGYKYILCFCLYVSIGLYVHKFV